jgi:hypothetical protein
MQLGNCFTRIVVRKLQSTGRSFQFILLSGYDAHLTQKSATFWDTMSPNHVLTLDEIQALLAKHVALNNATGYCDKTDGDALKKLTRMFGEKDEDVESETFGKYFPSAEMEALQIGAAA